MSFFTYKPAPRGLAQNNFYSTIIESQVSTFHHFKSLAHFSPDPIVQGSKGLQYKFNKVEVYLESASGELTYSLVIDILGGCAQMMKVKGVSVLHFAVRRSNEPQSHPSITSGWIDKDPYNGDIRANQTDIPIQLSDNITDGIGTS